MLSFHCRQCWQSCFTSHGLGGFGGEGVRKTASKIRTISVSWKDYMHVDDVIVCVVTRRGIVLKYGPMLRRDLSSL